MGEQTSEEQNKTAEKLSGMQQELQHKNTQLESKEAELLHIQENVVVEFNRLDCEKKILNEKNESLRQIENELNDTLNDVEDKKKLMNEILFWKKRCQDQAQRLTK